MTDKMFKKISYLVDYFKYLDNPLEVLKFKFGLTKSCNIKIKNTSYEIDSVFILNRIMSRLKYLDYSKIGEYIEYLNEIEKDYEILNINGIKFLNTNNSDFKKKSSYKYVVDTEEYFNGDDWSMINFNNRHVIDIGGNNGDTALYFAKEGAKVISFEPIWHLYDLALKNINLNENFKNNITMVNKAVGAKKGKLNINSDSIKDYIENDTTPIEITTIPTIINDYNFTPDILKMDCEGCEFEIIEKEDLTMFNDIIFEHHSKITGKDYNMLIKKLKENGFKCDTYNNKLFEFEEIGIIHAYK